MPRDDNRDDLTRSPDEPASPAEQTQAASFAALVDQLMAGQRLPPAMASDERDLVEVAAVIRACTHEAELSSERRDALIDDAMKQAPGQATAQATAQAPGQASDAPAPGKDEAHDEAHDEAQDNVIDLGARRRKRLGTLLPWTLAAAAAAAALVLALQRPVQQRTAALEPAAPAAPELHQSRPADDLVGRIPRDRADRASDRLDIIYADRMAGYRDLRLRGGNR